MGYQAQYWPAGSQPGRSRAVHTELGWLRRDTGEAFMDDDHDEHTRVSCCFLEECSRIGFARGSMISLLPQSMQVHLDTIARVGTAEVGLHDFQDLRNDAKLSRRLLDRSKRRTVFVL